MLLRMPLFSVPAEPFCRKISVMVLVIGLSANIPPFDHDGRQALQAAVFHCGGKDFVGYLIRYDKASKAALDAMPEADRKGTNPKALQIRQNGEMVKKPGDTDWISLNGNRPAGQIVSPACPDGSDETPKQISP